MSRDYRLFLDDMKACCAKIARYIGDMTYESFIADEKTFDAVVRNLEIVGEAAKHIPAEIKDRHIEVEWSKAAGIRDIIAHEYFGIDDEILWDVVSNHIPRLATQLRDVIRLESDPS